jgi:hypothetical protein
MLVLGATRNEAEGSFLKTISVACRMSYGGRPPRSVCRHGRQTAVELKDQGIVVNSANPGFTATDLNAYRGQQTVEEGAVEIVRLALNGRGESGKFLETGGEPAW